MCENRFYVCEHCGNVVGLVNDKGVPLMCCGQKMKQLEANTVDASVEKHLPVISTEGNVITVTIGEVAHPMTVEHNISWVYMQTDRGGQRKCLNANSAPVVTFAVTDEKPVAVYAYCNLHGLWKTDF